MKSPLRDPSTAKFHELAARTLYPILLADKVVELNIASSVPTMTVQRTLKKTNCVLT